MSPRTQYRFRSRTEALAAPATRAGVKTVRPEQPLAEDDAAGRQKSSPDDVLILRLFCAWIFLGSFYYTAVPFLRFNVGIVITPDRIALLTLIGAVLLRSLRSQSAPPPALPVRLVGYMAVLFSLAALTSWYVTGSDATSTKFGNLTWITNLALCPTFAFFVARRLRYNRAMLKQVVTFFAFLGVYLSATAFAEHFQFGALVFPKYILDPNVGIHAGRSRGPFVDTIQNGTALNLAFMSWSWLAGSFTGAKRRVAIACALMIVPAVYFTETRSVWLSLAAITGTMFVLRTSHRTTARVVLGVLACAFVFGIGSKFSAFDETLFSRRQNTVDYRLDNYEYAWNAFKDNPLFGLGYGRFQYQWSQYADLQNSRLGIGLDDGNHSTLLGILADLGLSGGVPFVLLVIFAAFVCQLAYRRVRRPDATDERRFVVISIGMLLVYIIQGITSDLKADPIVTITTFWFLGMASSIESNWRRSTVTQKSAVPSRIHLPPHQRPSSVVRT